MERLLQFIRNFTGELRREQWLGEDYIVCPVTMVVSGVLDGSEGPLYYPPSELEMSVNDWNGMPVVVYHPEIDGQKVSARNPHVLNVHLLGWVFNAGYSAEQEKLYAEAWINPRRMDEMDELLDDEYKLLPRLQQGKPVEISTGLFTKNDKTPGVTSKGIAYNGTAHSYKPDHLAVLPDKVGACSLKAGCGMFATNALNEPKLNTPSLKGNEMKDKLVRWLATNCDCWKGDVATLNSFTEARLKQLKSAAVRAKINQVILSNGKQSLAVLVDNNKMTRNADGETQGASGIAYTDMADLFGITTDPSSDPVGFVAALKDALSKELAKLDSAGTPNEEPPGAGAKPDAGVVMEVPKDQTTTTNQGAKVTLQDLFTSNPTAAAQWNQMVANNAKLQAIEAQQKNQLINDIMGAMAFNEATAPSVRPVYERMSLSELQTLAAGMPQLAQNGQGGHGQGFGMPSFVGAAGGFVGQPGYAGVANDADDVYPDPHSYWRETATK